MGLYSSRVCQLASADDADPHAGLPVVWVECRRASLDERPVAHRLGDPPVSGAAADDGVFVAQCVCGGGVCDTSVAGGIGGVGGGTQGCAQRAVFHADAVGVHALRARTVERRASRVECRNQQFGSRPSTLDPQLLSGFGVFCVGFAVQADAGDGAVRAAIAGLLAIGTSDEWRVAGDKIPNSCSSTFNSQPIYC